MYEAEFYETVINGALVLEILYSSHQEDLACALRQDLALLADGDMTEVGEKGQ